MNNQTDLNQKDHSYEHYRTSGAGLILVGVVNVAVASYSLIMGSKGSFIDYEMMLTFGVSFIAIGGWMRSFSEESNLHQ
jgi:hypothetical protein